MLVNRRRLLQSLAAGLVAAGVTFAGSVALASPDGLLRRRPAADEVGGRGDPSSARDVVGESNNLEPTTSSLMALGDLDSEDARILAVDPDRVRLPLAVGDTVELIGLVPTIDMVRTEVVAANATVVGVDERAILLLIPAGEAHRASEIAAVGGLEVLGRP
jgi:predicted RNA-binding protein